jgi:hypothetical protein
MSPAVRATTAIPDLEGPPGRVQADPLASDENLSPRVRDIADVIGVRGILSRIAELEVNVEQTSQRAQLRFLALKQDLSDRFIQVLFEVSEVAAEIDCEKARTRELAARLEEVENDIRNQRKVVAVVSEPVFHILAASFLVMGMPVVTGTLEIIGNGIRLSYGLAADQVAEEQEDLRHTHNFLQEIWEGPDESAFFPEPVWRFLNLPVKPGETATRREALVSMWRDRLGPDGLDRPPEDIQLFFGGGGVYGVRELRLRAEMLQGLLASVTLMHHEIRALFSETVD